MWYNENMEYKDLYKIEEVAELLRVDDKTVKRYIRLGKMKVVRLSHQTVRIPRAEIEYLLKDSTIKEKI